MGSNFFEGFAGGLQKGMEQRRLREQLRLEDAREQRREATQQEQFRQRQQLQQEQFQALENYRAQTNAMREKQIALETRKADLDFANGFTKAFDPKTPKAARRFLLGTMANHLGVDRKSQQFKDFDALVTGLEDEQLDALRGSIAAMIPQAQPGDIMNFAKTIMNGQTTLPQLIEVIGKTQTQKTREQIMESAGTGAESTSQTQGGGASASGSVDLSGQPPGPIEQRRSEIEAAKKRQEAFQKAGLLQDAQLEAQKIRDLQQAGEFEPELRGAIKSEELAAEEKVKAEKPISPAITRILGIPGVKLTEGRAKEMGIATDILDAKTLRDINTQKAAAHTTIKQIEELQDMIVPGSIGKVGDFVRGVNTFMEQALAIPEAAGMTSAEFNKAARGMIPKELAKTSAVIRSRMTDLAFNMAKAIDDGRLSNQDVERFSKALGESGSETQFVTVLDDMKERLRSGAATNIEALTGVKPIDLMTPDELNSAIDEIQDVDMMRAVIKEQERRRGRKK